MPVLKQLLAKFENSILNHDVDQDPSYWFVRTTGGLYYDEFIKLNYVGYGYNEFTLEQYKDIFRSVALKARFGAVKGRLKTLVPKEKKHGIGASQLIAFLTTMAEGDIVLIPSYNSHEICFGVVEGEPFESNEGDCPHLKRRHVKWFKKIKKHDLDPYFTNALSGQRALANMTAYRDFVERSLYDFYIDKEGRSAVVVSIGRNEDIPAKELFALGLSLINKSESFSNKNGLDLSFDDLTLQIALNSKGKFILKSKDYKKILIAVAAISAITGGEIKVGGILELSFTGVLPNLVQLFKENENIRNLDETADKLQITTQGSTSDSLK